MNLTPFRKETVTEVIDDNGSTHEIEENFRRDERAKPRRHRYELRHGSDKIKLSEIEAIAERLLSDRHKLDTTIKLQRDTKDPSKFVIVECYTVLEY